MNSSSIEVGGGTRIRGKRFKAVDAAKQTLNLQNITTDDPKIQRSLAEFTEHQRQTALLKLHYLQQICPYGQVLNRRKELPAALRASFANLPEGLRAKYGLLRPPSVASFYAWRKAWINSGYQLRSLVDRFDLRGRRPDETPAKLLPFIEQAIVEKYETKYRPTLKETIDYAAGLVERHNLLVPPLDALPRPTRRQVMREVHRRDRYVMLERRHGRAQAQAATRVYRKKEEPERLLDRVEVDHSPLDILVLTSENGLVARPYLTVLIDVASRMVLGLWISVRTPNRATVLRALKVSIQPKDQLLRGYKIKNEYPAYGTPRELFLDNGREFHSSDFESAALDLGITLVYCPSRQPRFKGVVERWLKEINYSFMHLLPGTTFDRYFKRGELDSQKDAVFLLEDLTRLIWKWIVTVYACEYHRGIRTCPLERWKELLPLGKPVLPKRADVLSVYLSPTERRTLSSKGIEINSQHYVCPTLDDLRHRLGNVDLTVRPDLDDLGRVWVLHPESDAYFEAYSTMPAYANGLSVEHDEWIRRLARERYAALPHQQAVLLAKQDLNEEVAAMVDAGTAAKAAAASKSSKSRPAPRAPSEKHAQAVFEVATKIRQEAPEATTPLEQHCDRAIDFGSLEPFPADPPQLL